MSDERMNNDNGEKAYEQALSKLSYKDCLKMTIAVLGYISKNEKPCFRGIRKDVFEEIRPILDRWKSATTQKKQEDGKE